MSSKISTLSQKHWFFDTNAFQPTDDQFKLLLNILPSEVKAKVTKFRALKDQKLSLISALIQRAMVRNTFACSNEDFVIKRTALNKPFVSSEKFPTLQWNYNVSHHGSFVTILSDFNCPIGIDLVQRSVRKSWKKSSSKYITQFSSQLTDSEQTACLKHPEEWMQYSHFFVIWSLKEAYIKAVGKGLYMDLLSVSFDVKFSDLAVNNVAGSAVVKIEGCERSDWEFTFSSLDSEHVVTVARCTGHSKENSNNVAECNMAPSEVKILDLLSENDQKSWITLEESGIAGGDPVVGVSAVAVDQ
jgi:4'-phosphopantetheinyl transferase